MRNYKKTILNFLIICFVFSMATGWVFFGLQQIWQKPSVLPDIMSANAATAKNFKGEDINFFFTDNNAGENLIIKTNEKTYIGLTKSEVYFSVTNIGDKSELVNFQIYFPENTCKVKKIEKYTEDDWQKLELSDNFIPDTRNFFEKLFHLGINRKPIPENFKVDKSSQTECLIISGQTQYFKMEINCPINSSGEFYIEAIGDKEGYGLLDPWWSSGWTFRKQITIDHTKVDGDLTNFPVLINLSSDANLEDNAQNDGDDIAFTSSNGTTQLDHEIEDFNGATGELQAWVEITSLSSSSNTVIYMYYGNSTCGTQEDVSGTWDSNHKLVHHLNDLTTSTTEDSTSNNNDATKATANEPIETDGKIGKAQNFDGNNDYEKITNTVITSPSALTISAWFKKPSDGPTYECALHQSSNYTIGNSSYWLGVCSSNYLTATIGARTSGATWSSGRTSTTATYGEWYHLAASWNGSVVRVYINGDYDKQYNLGSYSNLTTPTRFGASSDVPNYQFKGIVDEVRISTTNRGAAWIKTGYNNQNSPSSFYTLGAEAGISPTTLHNIPFDNEETPDTTPLFEFTAEDLYGTSDLVYQIEWDDNIAFSSPTTRTSDTHSGFINTENGSDTNPFTENQRIRFTIQAGDALSNSPANTSYYWRVRAKNNGGSFGVWTSTNSLRVDSSLSTSQWTQTTDEQFDTGTLTDTETSGSDNVGLATGSDIKSARGTFTTPSTTGNHSITGVGFQPKAIMFWGVPRTDENTGSDATQFIGFSDGTRHRVSSIKAEDGVYDNGRSQYNTYAIYLRSNVASNLLVRAVVSSFDSDGFTLNYNAVTSGTAYVIHYIAFGGDDLSAYVGNKLVSASPLTGLSFAPDIIFTATTGLPSGNDDTHGIHSFGVVDKNNFWHRGSHQGSNTGTKDSWLTSNSVCSQTYSNGVNWQMTNVSLTSDGMSWSGSDGDHFQYLALNLDGNKTKVGLFQKETSGTAGATQDLTGWGFTSDAAIVGFASAGKTSTALSDHCHFTHGSYDGTNQGMVGMGDANGSTASKSIQNNDNAITIINTGAVIQVGGTASQLDNDGVRLTWSPNNTSAYYIGYWAIEGSAALAASGSVISSTIDYDWVSSMALWDELSWNDVETNGDLKYQIQYWDGDSWELIPNGDLSGNSTGFDTSPVDLSGLNTTTYNQIKIKANFTNSNGSPTLQDWAIIWKPPVISITITSDGTIAYGVIAPSTTQDTTASGVNDTQTAQNDGNVIENFKIKSTHATRSGGTDWTLAGTVAANIFTHKASLDGGSAWDKIMSVADTYVSLKDNAAVSENVNFDLQIGMPTSITDYLEHNITITVMAEQAQ